MFFPQLSMYGRDWLGVRNWRESRSTMGELCALLEAKATWKAGVSEKVALVLVW